MEEQWHPARVTRYTAPKLDGAGDSAAWLSEWQVYFRYDDGSEPLRWSKGQPLHGAESALLLAPRCSLLLRPRCCCCYRSYPPYSPRRMGSAGHPRSDGTAGTGLASTNSYRAVPQSSAATPRS